MSLPVLLAAIVIGLFVVVVVLHSTGASRDVTIGNETTAIDAFREQYPFERVRRVLVDKTRETAFLELDGGGVGIVRVMGRNLVVRKVVPIEVSSITRTDPATVKLTFRDLAWSRVDAKFTTSDDAGAVMQMFGVS